MLGFRAPLGVRFLLRPLTGEFVPVEEGPRQSCQMAETCDATCAQSYGARVKVSAGRSKSAPLRVRFLLRLLTGELVAVEVEHRQSSQMAETFDATCAQNYGARES